ncbi:MAG: 2Fe-2S iron-sulfur cluster-binding protein [Paracoccaceae bacterium]|jgi:ferredoxin|nr:2Fe-2S iron-sulfur cluster-binding protein [Paracoccaceae bacterium]
MKLDIRVVTAPLTSGFKKKGGIYSPPSILNMSQKVFKVVFRNRENKVFFVDQDTPVIDAVEKRGYVLPIACRYGGCITCAAKMISGRVKQPKGTALNKRQSKEGYVLLCVARPQEDCVFDVGVESHDKLYVNPFSMPNAQELIEKGKAR